MQPSPDDLMAFDVNNRAAIDSGSDDSVTFCLNNCAALCIEEIAVLFPEDRIADDSDDHTPRDCHARVGLINHSKKC